MNKGKVLVTKIKKWLKYPGNTKIELAYKLGYKSSSAISNWISRGNVPTYMHQRVEEILL